MNQITLNGLQILILKKIEKSAKNSINKDLLIQSTKSLFHKRANNFNNEVKFLLDNKYILVNDDKFSLDEKGELFLKDFDDFESKEMNFRISNFAILKFLYLISEPVPPICFPEIIKKYCPGKHLSSSSNLEDYLKSDPSLKEYVQKNSTNLFSINKLGIEFFEKEVKKENKHLDSFLNPGVNLNQVTPAETFEINIEHNKFSDSNDDKSIFGEKLQYPLKNQKEKVGAKANYIITRRKIFYSIIIIVLLEMLYLIKSLCLEN